MARPDIKALRLIAKMDEQRDTLRQLLGDDKFAKLMTLAHAALREEMQRMGEDNPFAAIVRLRTEDSAVPDDLLVYMALAACEVDRVYR